MENENKEYILRVYGALQEKGYNAVGQIVGYLLTEDPTYITNHLGARNLIRKIDRYPDAVRHCQGVGEEWEHKSDG